MTEHLPATQAQTTKVSQIRWSEQSLPATLVEPVRRAANEAFAYLPVVGPEAAAQIPAVIDHLEAGLTPSSDDQIERMMLKIALLYPNGKLSDPETEARLELYVELLRDIPFDILSAAFRAMAQTSTFFPTVAEIRATAAKAWLSRRSRVTALRMLLLKHEREWEAPIPQHARASPEDVAKILADAGIKGDLPGRVRATGPLRKPTDADYLEWGVTPDQLEASRQSADPPLEQSQAA